jgi:hypothetical protein
MFYGVYSLSNHVLGEITPKILLISVFRNYAQEFPKKLPRFSKTSNTRENGIETNEIYL